MDMLEKAFAAEIDGRMYQTKAAMAKRLVAKGYLQEDEQRFRDRFGEIVCKGYSLTHLGRLTYCASCPAPPEV
jgi:hypothetical protein